MRIAIISDIHSNLEALSKTVEIIKKNNIDTIVCLGDIVGYGANPVECIEIVQKISKHIVMGNHDQAVADLDYTDNFNPYARAAAYWTNKILSQKELQSLLSLPYSIDLEGLTFLHASPNNPSEWDYITSYEDAVDNFQYMNHNICFIGHSHISEIYCEDYDALKESCRPQQISNGDTITSRFKLIKGKKYIINVGSVGQPRDRDWRLSFGIFNTETLEYENIRSEYNVELAAKKIIEAKLPRYLADRILIGR